MNSSSTTLSSEQNLAEVSDAGRAKAPVKLGKSRLWVWFLLAFCVQITAWTAWITIASHHKVQEVPLDRTSTPAR